MRALTDIWTTCKWKTSRRFEAELYKFAETARPGVLTSIREKKELNDEIKGQVKDLLTEFKQKFTATLAAAKA